MEAEGEGIVKTIKLDAPDFKNEAEEAEWWYQNRHLVEAGFVRMIESEMTGGAKTEAHTTPVPPLFVEPEDAALAMEQALRKGLPFEEHARKLFHEAVRAEEMKHAG